MAEERWAYRDKYTGVRVSGADVVPYPAVDRRRLISLMCATKWQRLCVAMDELDCAPDFRIRFDTGSTLRDYYWTEHFPCETAPIVWVDVLLRDEGSRSEVRAALRGVRAVGEETSEGFRVVGYVEPGAAVAVIGTAEPGCSAAVTTRRHEDVNS
jgi:hypothetical protein